MTIELIWHKVHIMDADILKLKKTKIDSFIDHIDDINELLRQYPRVDFKMTHGPRAGWHLRKTYLNQKYGSMVVGTDCRTTLQIVIHAKNKGWCLLQTERDSSNLTSKVSGTKALRELIINCPEIKDWIDDDVATNKQYREHSRQYYDADTGFQGIPSSAKQYNGQRIHHVWSIDVNSAFPAALTEVVPSTTKYITELYDKRKTDAYCKQLLNNSIGTMCSNVTSHLGYAPGCLSRLRDTILDYHNQFLHELIDLLESQGAIILNKRTDSLKFIWTKDTPPNLGCVGPGLGELKYDFCDCDYLQLSTSKYQYLDGDQLHVVISGVTRLDRIKPRDQWVWNDIFHCGNELKFVYDEDEHQFRRSYK